jgi:hypothetical protein
MFHGIICRALKRNVDTPPERVQVYWKFVVYGTYRLDSTAIIFLRKITTLNLSIHLKGYPTTILTLWSARSMSRTFGTTF